MGIRVLILSVACTASSVYVSEAATYVVRPDGTGDFPTIQAAVTAAVTGDVIELAPGTFTGTGNRDVSIGGKTIVLRSQSGDPATCTIDCQGAGRGFHLLPCEGRHTISGITITTGVGQRGGGILDESYLGGDFTDCVFSRNAATSAGGGLNTFKSCAFVRCAFVENTAVEVGGGFFCGSGGAALSPTFEECRFIGNTAGYSGGAAYIEAVYPARDVSFHACTFAYDAAPEGAVMFCGYAATLSNCIVAFATDGPAVNCPYGGSATLACCDIYGNAGGDWVGCIAGQQGQNGNLALDPLFCNGPGGDVRLQEDSPCAPEQNPACGLIGAQPVACPSTAVERGTWGRIKGSFR